jgi:hypothetical protein
LLWLHHAAAAVSNCTLQCGYFADKLNRVHLLAFIIVLGEAPCLCTYWVSEWRLWAPEGHAFRKFGFVWMPYTRLVFVRL